MRHRRASSALTYMYQGLQSLLTCCCYIFLLFCHQSSNFKHRISHLKRHDLEDGREANIDSNGLVNLDGDVTGFPYQ